MNQELNYKIYTPEKFAIGMGKLALDRYIKEFQDVELKNLRIIDISCGSGNLLLAILEEIFKYQQKKYGKCSYRKEWITGYDIDENALNIFFQRGKKLLKKYEVEGKLNLNKEDSLHKIFSKKYHIVLGNPPYLGEKNHKEVFQELKLTEFGKKYYQRNMDYFYFFIEKGIDILEKNGILIYLTTNYWLKADSATLLREKLRDEGSFYQIENYEYSIFKEATGQHNIIFSWIKNKEIEKVKIIQEESEYFIKKEELFEETGKIALVPPLQRKVLEKIKEKSNCRLGDILKINQGIVSGADKVFVFDEIKEEYKEFLKPFYKNKDIGKYSVTEEPPFWILYLDSTKIISKKLLQYLENFRDILSKRREVMASRIKWWQLQWARDEEIFKKPKIVVRQRCKTNNFAYTEKDFYGSADIYYLTEKDLKIDLFYILGYLNSSVFLYWFNYIGKRKGVNLEFYSTPLKESPIYYPNSDDERRYVSELVKQQLVKYDEEIQKKIDEYFEELFEIKV